VRALTATAGVPAQDFGRVLRTLFRFARTISYVLIVVMVVWFLDRLAVVVGMAGAVHPLLGVAAGIAIAAAVGWFVGRPVYRFLRMPVTLKPPDLPPMAERTSKDLVRHLTFVERYVASLPKNPEWSGEAAQVDSTISALRALREEADRAEKAALAGLSQRVGELERDRVSALLAPLDRKATDAIRAEAVAVGIATAVSPNGTLDAFVVLWRNCNLVSRLARIYYGRPGTRGTLSILRDVSVATMASAYLQDLSELAGSLVGTIAGHASGVVAGPLVDGSLNAVATLRIGYVAKTRCRSLAAWNERTRIEAVRSALREAAALSSGVLFDVVRTVGGGVLKLPLEILNKMTQTITGLFRRPDAEAGELPAQA
jgi:hypothetical protein